MEKTEKMIDKIKKVMELADRGSTEAERDTAMLQAQKLLDKYNLSMAEVMSTNKDKKYVNGKPIKTVSKETVSGRCVADIIKRYYNVQIIIYRGSDEHGYPERTLKIFGQKHNVSIARYMHEWLISEFDYRWNLYKMANKLKGTKYKNTYIFGLYAGLKEKLKQQREELAKEYSGSTDLAVLDETAEIMNWLKSGMDIKTKKGSAVSIKSNSVFNAGHQEGSTITLTEQVSE